eukprot:TRINITY_DN1351_c2_g1_i1.p1 TRINITY_DN1351_c2_g1~~TRINITY_DN1351_c2_g1_i1.p1  ORF type:complete len:465 (-),score=208.45 TRINITY_DN1351_c2_g1_i1:169-1563(-)
MFGLLGGSAKNGDPVNMEDCPTPTTREQYEALCERTLRRVKELVDASDWNAIDFADRPVGDIQLFDKPTSTTFNIIKTQGTLPCSTEELYYYLVTDNLSARKEWEKEVLEMKVVEHITSDIKVIYSSYQAPFPVTSREFVAIQSANTETDGSIYIYGTSINHSSCRHNSRFVRGVVTTGYIIKPVKDDPNSSYFIRVVEIDPKGSIPTAAVRATKKKAAIMLLTLKKVIQNNTIFKQICDESRARKITIPSIKVNAIDEKLKQQHPQYPQQHQLQQINQNDTATIRLKKIIDETVNQRGGSDLIDPLRIETEIETNSNRSNNYDSDDNENWDSAEDPRIYRIENLLSTLNSSFNRLEQNNSAVLTQLERINQILEREQPISNRIDQLERTINNLSNNSRFSWHSIGIATVVPIATAFLVKWMQKKKKKFNLFKKKKEGLKNLLLLFFYNFKYKGKIIVKNNKIQ